MDLENNNQVTPQNRLYGLLFLAVIGIMCWYCPPTKFMEQRRGALGVVQDMGMGDAALKIRLAIYWIAVIVAVSMGVYQVVTGRRIRRPDL